MSESFIDSCPSAPAETMDTAVLLRNLNRFPSSVLPLGLLRELQSRGAAIHDDLVAEIKSAIDAAENGAARVSDSSFFATALLVPLATEKDRPLVESLLALSPGSLDKIIGDLHSEALQVLVANFFREFNAAEMLDWIQRVSDQLEPKPFHVYSLLRAVTVAVEFGYLDRNTGIEFLVERLKSRADKQDDLQSALIVCDLMDLSAHQIDQVDAVVRECFNRGQIDTSHVGVKDWENTDRYPTTFNQDEAWSDPALVLTRWCYDYLSHDLDPVDAKFFVNQQAEGTNGLEKATITALVEDLRRSSDAVFPREAVQAINSAFPEAYAAVVDLIHQEVLRFQENDSSSWSGNGAYLGLVLTVSHSMPLPTDLLEQILLMSEEDRTKLLSDQFELIVRAIALTPFKSYDFVEQWIWDSSRSDPDRREMVSFYPQAFYCGGQLDLSEAVEAMVAGLQRALDEEPLLIGPYVENLSFLSPLEHSNLIEQALGRPDATWFESPSKLRLRLQDVAMASIELDQWNQRFQSYSDLISEGVMFDTSALREKTVKVPLISETYQPASHVSSTVRNENVRVSRNDPCPCGSGKKFKKCCMNL